MEAKRKRGRPRKGEEVKSKRGRPKKQPDVTNWQDKETVTIEELEVIFGVTTGPNSKVRRWIRAGLIPKIGKYNPRISTEVVKDILAHGHVEKRGSQHERIDQESGFSRAI